MRTLATWLRRHSIRAVEAGALVLVFLLGLYRALGSWVALPSLSQDLALPVLCVLLLGLYVSDKWVTWTARPEIELSDRLVLDSINVWRFTCLNRGKACEVRARVISATDNRGQVLIDRQHLPIELPWTHHQGVSRLRVGPNDRLGITSALLFYVWQAGIGQRRFKSGPRLAVAVYGDKWQPVLGQVSRFRNRTLSVTVAVDTPDLPELEAVEHTYHLAFDRTSAAKFRATP
jgi:hypothetical protein